MGDTAESHDTISYNLDLVICKTMCNNYNYNNYNYGNNMIRIRASEPQNVNIISDIVIKLKVFWLRILSLTYLHSPSCLSQ